MGTNQKNLIVERKIAQAALNLAEIRRYLTPQGIARLIQLQAELKGLGDLVQPQFVADKGVAERGIYNNR